MLAYNKINSREEIRKLFQMVIDREIPIRIVCRENEEEQDFYAEIDKHIFEKEQDFIIIKISELAHKKYLKDRNVFMSFFVEGGAAYYVKFKIIAEDPNGFVCKIPELIFRVQRRNYYRVLVVNKGLKVGFNDKESKAIIVRDVIDIGIGGCSIHISQADIGKMKIGELIRGFRLKLESNLYISPIAAIRFVGTVTMGNGNKMLKCGIEFVKMSASDEKELSYRVYSMQRLETFKYKNT